jgi:hypothetical protein
VVALGGPGGFYGSGAGAPARPRPAIRAASGEVLPAPAGQGRLATAVLPRAFDLLGRLFPVTRDTWLRRGLRGAAGWVARRPRAAAAVERVERAIKAPLFGCQACGNCVLGHLEYVCPQTCPKQLRNGPCGGTHLGRCEVVDRPCIWLGVYDRARAAGRLPLLATYVPPPERALHGTSSWLNYLLERDRRPGVDPSVQTGA